jgi:hypothetical protein
MLKSVRGRFDHTLLNSVMTFAFFGCFRASEFCVTGVNGFDPSYHLCFEDLTIDLVNKSMCVLLKRSKSDILSNGTTVHIGCSGERVCAYCMMRVYLVESESLHVDGDSPLFVTEVGGALSKEFFIYVTRLALGLSGYNPAKYSGHSFRAGTATTAGDKGFEEWEFPR